MYINVYLRVRLFSANKIMYNWLFCLTCVQYSIENFSLLLEQSCFLSFVLFWLLISTLHNLTNSHFKKDILNWKKTTMILSFWKYPISCCVQMVLFLLPVNDCFVFCDVSLCFLLILDWIFIFAIPAGAGAVVILFCFVIHCFYL